MKASSEHAVHLNSQIMAGVKEIEPWGIYEQTAWEYVRTMVEEEERRKLHLKSHITRDALKNVYFEYQNRSVKMLMLPVVIAQNNNLHDFFTIFISGITGIPAGLSLHKMPTLKNIPLIRVVCYSFLCSYSIGQVFYSHGEIQLSEVDGLDYSCMSFVSRSIIW